MAKIVKKINEEYVAKSHCHHYWMIESASGRTSKGFCKNCGAIREFSNRLSDARWDGDPSLLFELDNTGGAKEEGKKVQPEAS